MAKKRIFVAIHVPDEIKKEIFKWQENHSFLNVRWISPKNLHITIVPPWYADDQGVEETVGILEKKIDNFNSFPVSFNQVNYGPAKNRPRLIWAEGDTPKRFGDLKADVEDSLLLNESTGFRKKEKRLPKLHLTIARFNFLKNLVPLDSAINWSFNADTVELLESKLKKTGAEYSALRSFILRK